MGIILRHGLKANIDAQIAALFANSEPGLWYAPSDFSTLFQDSAGTTPVTAIEQPVGKMLDKSGRGNHATQATNAARPTLKQDTAGRYYLKPDGTNDFMVTASINFSGSDKLLVSAAMRKLDDAGGYKTTMEFSDVANSGNPGSFGLHGPDTAQANFYISMVGTIQLAGTLVTAAFTAPITNVFSMVMDISAATAATELYTRVDGVDRPHQAGGSVAGTGNFGNYPLYLFSRGGTGLFTDFPFFGAVIRGGTSTSAQIALVESYLADKSGVVIA